jgi:hypothetical protein
MISKNKTVTLPFQMLFPAPGKLIGQQFRPTGRWKKALTPGSVLGGLLRPSHASPALLPEPTDKRSNSASSSRQGSPLRSDPAHAGLTPLTADASSLP